jgi:hypothetical protein
LTAFSEGALMYELQQQKGAKDNRVVKDEGTE